MSRIPHHLIDIKEPWEHFSVGEFVKEADAACRVIEEHGNTPVICGGTAYYFKHFYFGLPESPKSDPETRARVARMAESHGLPWCHAKLAEVDPISAQKIHPADGYRITRALEVFEASGRPLSSFHVPTKARKGLQPVIIGLQRGRDELEQRIIQRVEHMFATGLQEEFNRLLEMGATPEWPGMQGIGYREFFEAQKDPKMDRQMIANLIVRNSRLYAKRQMTFFKSLPDVHWVHPSDLDSIRSLL